LNSSIGQHCFDVSDVTPPAYLYDQDDSGGAVDDGDTMQVSAYWNDDLELDSAVLRSNETGSWVNSSYFQFAGAPQYSNFSVDSTGHFGETVCWVIWANDTSGNLNSSMGQHCFDVVDNTPPVYQYDGDDSSGEIESGDAVEVSAYWNDTASGLGTAALRTNESGSWAARDYHPFSAAPEYSNFTMQITDHVDETICWVIWANDTVGNLNDSMGQHCFDVADTTPPVWSQNSTDSTVADSLVEHRLYWEDAGGLAGYIFSFDNCIGSFVNDSWIPMTGPANWSNVTKYISDTVGCTVRWRVYANDTKGRWNDTGIISYQTTEDNPPYWYDNSTNSSLAGRAIQHSVKWTEDSELSGYIFSWHNGANWTLESDKEVGTGTIQIRLNVTENVDVPTSCRDGSYGSGQNYELYSRWTTPDSGEVTVSGLRFYDSEASLSSSESIEVALYNESGDRITEIVIITGTGSQEWLTGKLSTTVNITLGENYTIGVGPSGGSSYAIGRDTSADCSNYPPTGAGSLYESASGGLNDQVPGSQHSDKFSFWGIEYEVPEKDGNTTYSTYQDVDSDHERVLNITVKIEIDSYNPEASVNQSTGDPDLEVEFYDGTGFVSIGVLNLNESYTGDTLNTTNANFTLTTTDSSIMEAWETADNQDLRIRGIYMDSVNSTLYDEINYTNVWVTIYHEQEFLNDSWMEMTGQVNWSNVTKVVNSTVGATIKWIVYANDTTDNWNATDVFVYITIEDTEPPYYLYDQDNSSGSVVVGDTVLASTLWNDSINENSLSTAILRTNKTGSFVNESYYSFSTKPEYSNFSINSTGHFGETICWVIWANDTSGNLNSSMVERCFNVVDIEAPAWYQNQTSIVSVYSPSQLSLFNITWVDEATSVHTVYIEGNWSGSPGNYTMYMEGDGVYQHNLTLHAGSFYWRSWANDSAGNLNVSDTWEFTVSKADILVWLFLNGTEGDFGMTYGETSNASTYSSAGTVQLWRNGSQVGNPEVEVLGAGYWEYHANATGDQNYTDNSSGVTYYLTVDQAASSAELYVNGSRDNMAQGYGDSVNVSGYCDYGSVSLWRNESSVANPYRDVLGAGYWNFTAYCSGDGNHTGSTEQWFVTVNRASMPLYLYINDSADNVTLTYGNTTNVSGYKEYVEGSLELLLNGSAGSNPDIDNLGTGYWNYTLVFDKTQNYTANSTSLFITMKKRASQATLTLLPESPVAYDTSTTATCEVTNPEAAGILWRNGTDVSGENGTAVTLGAGYWEYVCNVSETGNYTSAEDSSGYTVNTASCGIELYLNSGAVNQDNTIIYGTDANATAYINFTQSVWHLERNGSVVDSGTGSMLQEIEGLGTGYWNYTAFWDGNENCTSCLEMSFLTVQKAVSGTEVYINGSRDNLTQTYGESVNVTAYCDYGSISLWRNDTEIGSPYGDVLGAGYWNFTAYCSGDGNHTGSTEQWFVTVEKGTTWIGLEVSPEGPVTYETQSTATCQVNNTEVSAVLWRNGTDVSGENGSAVTLGAGGWEYVCNCSETQNYTAASNTSYYVVDKYQKAVGFYLNGSQDNLSIDYPDSVNASAYTDRGSVTLLMNGSSVGNPYEEVMTAGYTYNFTAVSDGDDNYTVDTETFFLDVNQASSEIVLMLNGSSDDIYIIGDETVNHTAYLNASGTIYMYMNDSLMQSGSSPLVNISDYPDVGTFNISVNYSGDVNHTGAFDFHLVNVVSGDVKPPEIEIESPLNGSYHNITSVYANVTTDETVDWCGYSLDGQDDVSMNNDYGDHWTDLLTSLSDGEHNLTFWCNDTVGNMNWTESIFFVDLTEPFVEVLYPENVSYPEDMGVINYSFSDSLGGCGWSAYSLNSGSNVSLGCGNYSGSALGSQQGLNNLTVWARDEAWNLNHSLVFYTYDSVPPQYSGLKENVSNQSKYAPVRTYQFNVTWSDAVSWVDTVLINWDGVNYTSSYNTSTKWVFEIDSLAAGEHSYYWFANDSLGNANQTGTFTYDVVKADNAIWLYLNGSGQNITAVYGESVNASAYAEQGLVELYRNDTPVSNPEEEVLHVGVHIYRAYAPGNQNYSSNETVLNVTVEKATTEIDLVLSPGSPVTYGVQSTATCQVNNTEVSAVLWRNGTDVSGENGTGVTLGAGGWEYVCNCSETQNYTAASNTSYYAVSQADILVWLFLNGSEGNFGIGYGETSNASAYTDFGTVELWRNGTQVGNPEVETLGAGLWVYIANTTGDDNHTANESVWNLTVSKIASAMTLLLNGTDGDFNAYTYDFINITVYMNHDGSISLYSNRSLADSGQSPLVNISRYTDAGKLNITANYSGDGNHTPAEAWHILNISSETVAPLWYDQNQTSGGVYVSVLFRGESANLSASWSNAALDTAWLETNETGTWENKSAYGSPKEITGEVNESVFQWSNYSVNPGVSMAWRIYANDTSGNLNATDIMSLDVWGYANVSIGLDAGSVLKNDPLAVSCLVRDSNTSQEVAGYLVMVFDNTTEVSSGLSDSYGWFNYTYYPGQAGTSSISCNITGNTSLMYAASGNMSLILEINESESLNITVYSSGSAISEDSYIRIRDSSGDISSGNGSLQNNLEPGLNYTVVIDNPDGGYNMTAVVENITLSASLNVTAQFLQPYSGEMPGGVEKLTSVFALNDSDMLYGHAKLYIPRGGVDVDLICHCLDWNYSESNCSSWECQGLEDFGAESNDTSVWFNVTGFDGYAGGESEKAPWWNQSWSYRQEITINNSLSINLTEFQVNIRLNSSSVGDNFSWGSDEDALRFTWYNESDGNQTGIEHWIENWSASNQNASVWIRVPLIPMQNSSTVFMYYGNQYAQPVANFSGTFTKEYNKSSLAAQWHLDEGTGTQANDTSGQGNHGTVSGPSWVGQDGGQWDNRSDVNFSYGDSLDFNSDGDSVDVSGFTDIDGAGEVSIEMWVSQDSLSTLQYTLWRDTNILIEFGSSYTPSAVENLRVRLNLDGAWRTSHVAVGVLDLDGWHHWVFIWDGNNVTMYKDADMVYTSDSDSAYNSISTGSGDLQIGARDNDELDGKMDEVRIYTRVLTAGEIRTNYERRKYASQDPDVSIGEQERGNLPPWIGEPGTYNSSLEEVSLFQPGDTVTIGANGTDPDGRGDISSATVDISAPNGTLLLEDAPMENVSEIADGYLYEYNYTIPDEGNSIGTWDINVTINDSENAHDYNHTTFQVTEYGPPHWSSLNASDSNPAINDEVSFSSAWTDMYGLSGWIFSWNATISGTWENASSGGFSGTGNWSNSTQVIPGLAAGRMIGYGFYANDSSDNWNATDVKTIQVQGIADDTEPDINSFNTTPEIQGYGQNITIWANVTDNVAVHTVRANVTYPNGSFAWIGLEPESGDLYSGIFGDTWQWGDYVLWIWANDTAGNDANVSESPGEFYVRMNATLSLETVQDIYGPNKDVELQGPVSWWWNESWSYSKTINITNQDSSVLSMGYSVNLTLDTASLVGDGKLLANCSDLRVVWHNSSSGEDVELDRFNETACNASQTELWFMLQENISGLGWDANYTLYYGNPEAGEPPQNRSNIYLVWDDFEDKTLDQHPEGGWVDDPEDTCDWQVKSGSGNKFVQDMLTNGVYHRLWMGDEGWDNYSIEASIKLDSDQYFAGITFRRQPWSGSYYNQYALIDDDRASTDKLALRRWTGGGSNYFVLASDDTDFDGDAWNDFRIDVVGSNISLYRGGTKYIEYDISGDATRYENGSHVGLMSHTGNTMFDKVKVRLFSENEPAVALGGETNNTGKILNTGEINISGYLMMIVETNISGSWEWVATQVSDTQGGTLRNITAGGDLDIGELWNQNPWNTDSVQAGWYRVFAGFTDPYGNLIRNDSGDNISGYSNFYVDTEAPHWSGFGFNESYPKQGDWVEFYAYWQDDAGLSGWIFSWNATMTGEWQNVSSGSFSGLSNWSNTTRQIPSFADKQYGFRFYATDGSGLMNVTDTGYFTVSGDMEVELVEPLDGKLVAHNTTFIVNATVFCRNGECGSVQGRVRYNQSGAEPDTDISTSEDAPFYIMGGSNPEVCYGNPLSLNEYCNVTWVINATGFFGSSYKIGVLFESDMSNVDANQTENNTVNIVDLTAPYYQYDQDDSSGMATEGHYVQTSAYWDDNLELETAISRSNETGSWVNTSYFQFTGTPQYSNFSIDSTGHAGETICWVIWVNDTSGNLNDSMSQHCFDVNGPPQINSAEFNETVIDLYESVLLAVNVTDPDGVSAVIATFQYPDMGTINVTLIPEGGPQTPWESADQESGEQESRARVSTLGEADYNFSQGGGVDKWGWSHNNVDLGEGVPPFQSISPWDYVYTQQYSEANYTELGEVDQSFYACVNPGFADYAVVAFNFSNITQDPADINEINFSWVGYRESANKMKVLARNQTGGSWDYTEWDIGSTSSPGEYHEWIITEGFVDYIVDERLLIMAGIDDESNMEFWTDFVNLTINHGKPELDNDGNSSWVEYSFTGTSGFDNVTGIDVKTLVSYYDPRGSSTAGNDPPALEVQAWNGSGYEPAFLYNISSVMGDSAANATDTNFTESVTVSAVLDAWETVANRKIRVRSVYMDTAGSFNDTVNWTGVWVSIEYENISDDFHYEWSDTSAAGIYNITFVYANDSLGSWNSTAYADLGFEVFSDSTPPNWTSLSVNESYPKQGDWVEFSAYWSDEQSDLDSWIFSWNATVSGDWENVSSGSLSGAGDWSNATLQVPDYANSSYGFRFYANDTSGFMNVTGIGYFTVSGDMKVVLVEPLDGKLVAHNITFTVNATVTCMNGSCGNVQGRVRYNQTGLGPDTDVSTSEDEPFYVMGGSNPEGCSGSPLLDGEYCQLVWSVNATGAIGSSWKVGVLLESGQDNVPDNHTDNHTVQIVSCILDITLQWNNVSFEPIEPGERSNATGNENHEYNITVEPITTCNVDLYGRADDLNRKGGGGYTIGAGNISFSNTTNDYSEGHWLNTSWVLLGQAITPDTNLTTYCWIDVPQSTMEGEYNSTLYIEGVEEGEGA